MDEVHIQGILLREMLDRMEIVDVVTQTVTACDQRDWNGVAACLADEVEIDEQALYGEPPQRLTAVQAVIYWRRVLDGFHLRQCFLMNHMLLVDGERAQCVAAMCAQHIVTPGGGRRWVVGGSVTDELIRTERGWKIRGHRVVALWRQGRWNMRRR